MIQDQKRHGSTLSDEGEGSAIHRRYLDRLPGTKMSNLRLLHLSVVSLLVLELSSGLSVPPTFPGSSTEVVRQAATAIVSALRDTNTGKKIHSDVHRQSIQLPLSANMYSDKEEGFVADRAIGWQGGPQETYRALAPLVRDVLQEVASRLHDTGGLGAKLQEQVLLDFDGTGLLTAEHPAGAAYDIQAMLQPNTDDYYLDTIAAIEEQFSDTPGKQKRLFILVNPAWKDKSSWGMFGGARAQTQILDRYAPTFTTNQFVVRGVKMSLLQTWPPESGWDVFVDPLPYQKNEGNSQQASKWLGNFATRPDYQELDSLLLKS